MFLNKSETHYDANCQIICKTESWSFTKSFTTNEKHFNKKKNYTAEDCDALKIPTQTLS